LNKTILITGACGFIGYNLCEYILENTNYKIIVVDKKPIEERTLGIGNRIINYEADISIKNELEKIIEPFDYVIHLAAEKDVTSSYANIEPYILTNILGTSRFFHWLKDKQGIKKVINFSTAAVLGANKGHLNHEYAPYDPMNPYAGSKAGQEIIGDVYRNVYKLPIVSVRIDTPFGPYQPERNFIPFVIKNILQNKPITMLKKENSVEVVPSRRHWIFAETICQELINIINDNSNKKLYHLVGNNYNVLEIFEMINDIFNQGIKINWEDCDENSTIADRHLSYSLSSTNPDLPGSVTSYEFKKQIAETVAWYKRYFKKEKNNE
jgi:nucleoside-diphosphate-sugar epimerase